MSEHPVGVTGEAVVLELRLARLASRSLALAIDLVVQLVLFTVGTLVIGGTLSSVDPALEVAITLVFVLGVVIGYPVAMETATRGRSLGKLALGLRVVREDGGPVQFRHAFVRGLLGVVDFYLTVGSVALITSLASARGKRVGDFLAGTVVVRERVPVRGAPVAAMPPPLAAWAAGLDLSQVPDDLALAARQFLARAGELAPSVRDEMGARLADAMATVTAPPPPPGTPAWAFLAALLAERRNRELARLGGPVPPPAGPPVAYAPPLPAPSQQSSPPPTPAPAQPPPPPDGPVAGDSPFAPPG